MPVFLGFPGGSDGKESMPATRATWVRSIPGLGRSPGRRHGSTLQYSCPENPCGQRSLESHSSWGYKELDMAKRLSIAQHKSTVCRNDPAQRRRRQETSAKMAARVQVWGSEEGLGMSPREVNEIHWAV